MVRKTVWIWTVLVSGCAASSNTALDGRPALPSFSPPGGTYDSSQLVTISSATGGALIRCTQDGTTPTNSSPVCTAPIPVSVTTTLRAIATAPGLTQSDVASATYTIASSPPDVDPSDALRALSNKRQFFGHQSVGANIMYGSDGTAGLSALLDAAASSGVTLISNPANVAELPLGGWAEYELGTNGDPVGKIDEFDRLFRVSFAGALDFAGMKFCFADISEDTDVATVWSHYQSVMDALESDYPGRIIYWTGALLPWVEGGGNAKREQLNDLIRTKYGPTGRVFDFAGLEKHDAQGHLVLRDDPTTPGVVESIPAMAYEWSANFDGATASDGHLNNSFATAVARAYLDFMCALAASTGR